MPRDNDVFISYSQQADATLARNLERGLKDLGRKWNERRALTVFRDASSLSAAPDLWESLAAQLGGARYAIVLLSPEAAQSKWVGREIDHFLAGHDDDRLLLALTSGCLGWDERACDWSPDSDAVPPSLRTRYSDEPLWVDLRWARDVDDLDLRDGRFRSAVATLAAPVHGLSKDELESEDLRAHRRFVRIRRIAVASLILLLAAATTASLLALLFRGQTAVERALREEVELVAAQLRVANDELESTNDELDQANGDLETTNLQLDSRNRQLDQANDELEAANIDLDQANTELDLANTELEATNAELDQANVELDDANLDLAIVNTQLQIAEARAAQVAGVAVCIEDDLADSLEEAGQQTLAAASSLYTEWEEVRLVMADARLKLTADATRDEIDAVLDDAETLIDKGFERALSVLGEDKNLEVAVCATRAGYPFKDRWEPVIELASTRTTIELP